MLDRWRGARPRAVALAALALLAGFALVRLAVNGWHLSAFVVAGDALVDEAAAPDELVLSRNSYGYDGQFVYRLALDPLTRRETDFGITLDNPPYRQQRIGLAAVAWAVTRATPLSLAAVLVLVNALALAGAAWLGARYAVRHGRTAWWGLLAGLSPGLVVAFARDLTEPLTWFLLLAGLLWWSERRDAPAAAAFTAAVLCRETTLVVLAGLGLWLVATGVRGGWATFRERVPRALWLLVPLAAGLAWQWYVYRIWGRVPALAGGGHPGTPVLGVVTTFLDGLGVTTGRTTDTVLRHVWLLDRIWLAAFYAVVGLLLRRTAAPRALCLAWLLAALLGLTPTAWGRDVQFLRAANEAICVGVLLLLATRTRLADRMLLATGGVSLLVAGVHGLAI